MKDNETIDWMILKSIHNAVKAPTRRPTMSITSYPDYMDRPDTLQYYARMGSAIIDVFLNLVPGQSQYLRECMFHGVIPENYFNMGCLNKRIKTDLEALIGWAICGKHHNYTCTPEVAHIRKGIKMMFDTKMKTMVSKMQKPLYAPINPCAGDIELLEMFELNENIGNYERNPPDEFYIDFANTLTEFMNASEFVAYIEARIPMWYSITVSKTNPTFSVRRYWRDMEGEYNYIPKYVRYLYRAFLLDITLTTH